MDYHVVRTISIPFEAAPKARESAPASWTSSADPVAPLECET